MTTETKQPNMLEWKTPQCYGEESQIVVALIERFPNKSEAFGVMKTYAREVYEMTFGEDVTELCMKESQVWWGQFSQDGQLHWREGEPGEWTWFLTDKPSQYFEPGSYTGPFPVWIINTYEIELV